MQRQKSLASAQKRVVLAFGGNIISLTGSVADTISAALRQLETHEVKIVAQSRFFETPCFPKGAGPDYINLVAIASTPHTPDMLLEQLHDVEAQFGRARDARWAGRTLDIDILSYEDVVAPNLEAYRHWANLPLEAQMKETPEQLILPHPRIQDRGFVLIPLCDVWPEWVHPVSGKTAQMLCDALPISEKDGIKPM